MKANIFIAVFSIPFALLAQLNLTQAPGGTLLLDRNSQRQSGNRDIIWSEDFSNGIQSSWTNTEANGIASWEFRGPLTNPNVEVGTRGSCLPTGTLGDPIASPTGQNGYVIFDSNWWDNPDNPCTAENFGTGPAPGPHVATLSTPSIDLSSYSSVALVFNQYLKLYTGQTRVEISIAGGLWQEIFNNDLNANPTLIDDHQEIQISPWASLQSDVRIRFVFDGNYYFWMLDDIAIVTTFDNDLSLSRSTYGDFDLYDLSHPTGYEFMEYTKYPDEMPPHLKFSSQCVNLGGLMQTDVRLNVEVINTNTSTVIHTGQTAEGFIMGSGATMELRSGDFQMPATEAYYKVVLNTSQYEVEQNDSNNRDTMSFFINDVQYARDHLYTTAVYMGSPEYESLQYEIGNVFLVTEDNLSCHSVTVALGVGTITPSTIYAAIYSFDISTGVEATLLGITSAIDVTPAMINGSGDQILTNLTFQSPIAVEAGQAYYVALGSQSGVGSVVCALSGDAEEATSFVKYFPDIWFYLDRIPMVRMNFGEFNNVVEKEFEASPLSIYPVPAADFISLDAGIYKNEACIVTFFDHTGRQVKSQFFSMSHSPVLNLDISELSSGMYEVVLYSAKGKSHGKVVKQ